MKVWDTQSQKQDVCFLIFGLTQCHLWRHISSRAFGTDNHYLHQNVLKGFLKRNFSSTSVGGWKAKLWCYPLIWITHLATIERPWIEKLTGILSGNPLPARTKDGLSNDRSSTTVNTWENERKISKLLEQKAFVEVNHSCLVTMFKQQRSSPISNPAIHSDQKRLTGEGGGGEGVL